MAVRAAALVTKNTSAVGSAIAAHTAGRNCVAAAIGSSAKPVSNTSEVQLVASEAAAKDATVVRAIRSTYSASHAQYKVRRPAWRHDAGHRPHHVGADDRPGRHQQVRGWIEGDDERHEQRERQPYHHLHTQPEQGVFVEDAVDYRLAETRCGNPRGRHRPKGSRLIR